MQDSLAGASRETGVPAVVVDGAATSSAGPFTYWGVVGTRIVGEARDVKVIDQRTRHAFVRLFAMPELAKYGPIDFHRRRQRGGRQARTNTARCHAPN